MNAARIARLVCCAALLFGAQPLVSAPNLFTDAEADAVKAFLRQSFHQTNGCMVIGLVDEQGNRILAAGNLDNGSGREPDGDTVFFIGSVSKTFTTLLLEDMVARGEGKLDDPVAKYLPASVRMPTRNGKQITLLDLGPGSIHGFVSHA